MTATSHNVAELLRAPLAERPDEPALIEGRGARTRITTFAQLDLRARRIAALLAAHGVGAGDRIVFFEGPGAALYASLIAAFRLGAVAVFVEISAERRLLDRACAMCTPRALVASPRAHMLRVVSPALRRAPVRIVTRGWAPGAISLRAAERLDPLDATVPRDAADAALMTFTSGSTGQPKGAVRTHGILRAQLDALRSGFAAAPGECELVSLPIVTLVNLASGATTILPDADLRRPGAIDPVPVREQIAEQRVTRATLSPAVLERLASGSLDSLRTIVTGGGPVFPDIVASARTAAPRARVVSVYGSTEAEPIAHLRDDEVSHDDARAMCEGAGLLTGTPDPIVQLRILSNRWGTPLRAMSRAELDALALPRGEVGEIVVAGPHVVGGYLDGIGDAETKFRVDGVAWHRTGDLGRLDDRGRLWLLGRASAVISDAGGTLYPFAVECAARALLGGRRVAALGVQEQRVLVVERTGGVASSGRDDTAALSTALAWASLDRIVTVPRIPMDRRHNSKVDYTALSRLVAPTR